MKGSWFAEEILDEIALRHESQTSISLGVVYFRPLIAELKEFRKKCNLKSENLLRVKKSVHRKTMKHFLSS